MTTDLAKFDEVKAEMAKYKKINENIVFDYEDPDGNKAARSHIFKLRKTKAEIGKVHKEAKSAALAACQAVDKEKRDLIADVEEMIEVHNKPIIAIEEREKAIVEAAKEAERVEKERIELERQDAMIKQQEDLDRQAAKVKAEHDAVVREREKLEADKLAEAEAKRREVAARKEAEDKARRDKVEASEKAERDKVEAAELAERKKQAAIEAEQEKARELKEDARVAEEKQYLAGIEADKREAERVADVDHRKKIYDEVASIFTSYGLREESAAKLIFAISNEQYPALTINY